MSKYAWYIRDRYHDHRLWEYYLRYNKSTCNKPLSETLATIWSGYVGLPVTTRTAKRCMADFIIADEYMALLKYWWAHRHKLVLILGGDSECGKSALATVLLGVFHYSKNGLGALANSDFEDINRMLCDEHAPDNCFGWSHPNDILGLLDNEEPSTVPIKHGELHLPEGLVTIITSNAPNMEKYCGRIGRELDWKTRDESVPPLAFTPTPCHAHNRFCFV